MIASCSHLEAKFQECSKREEVERANSVETPGVDLRTRTRQLGAKEKARRKKCDVRFPLIRNNRVFQKNHVRTGVRKLLGMGWVPARA